MVLINVLLIFSTLYFLSSFLGNFLRWTLDIPSWSSMSLNLYYLILCISLRFAICPRKVLWVFSEYVVKFLLGNHIFFQQFIHSSFTCLVNTYRAFIICQAFFYGIQQWTKPTKCLSLWWERKQTINKCISRSRKSKCYEEKWNRVRWIGNTEDGDGLFYFV